MTGRSQDSEIDQKLFVFIGGLHRSGTSLIHECLREHPEISGFSGTGVQEDEGQLLQSVYEPAQVFGGPGKFGFNPGSYMDEDHELVSDVSRARLFSEWASHWDLTRRILIEKSPPNLVRTRFLQALFPNSKFVIVLRHPIAVAYATKKWSQTSIPALIEHTLLCYERFGKDLPHLKNVHILRYEEFVHSPQATLDRITGFIGIDKMTLPRDVEGNVNEKYFHRLELDCGKPVIGWYLTHCLSRQEHRTNAFGYSLIRLRELQDVNIGG
jgi:Sulfotransferase family